MEPLIITELEMHIKNALMRQMDILKVDLKDRQHLNAPVGCLSSTGPHMKEIVVHNPALIVPLFAVDFKFADPD